MSTEPKIIAAENRYKYLNSKGEHVHLLDGKPLIGTSRVGNVIAKPLSWYGAGKAVEVFGCPDPKLLTKIKNKRASKTEMYHHFLALDNFLTCLKNMASDDYYALIDRAYRAHDTYKKERAIRGTDIHAECEKFVKAQMSGQTGVYKEEIIPFMEWTRDNVKRFLWSEGHCYSGKHWIGGISDAGYELHDGRVGVLDFKSTKEAYVPQFWQCAGYDIQISENGVFDANGNQLYVLHRPITQYCIFPFGSEKPRPYFFDDPKGAKEAFLAALMIYKKLPQE